MSTIPKDKATPAQVIGHRRMQQKYLRHKHKFDKHRNKGPAFAERLDELERKLFGDDASQASDNN